MKRLSILLIIFIGLLSACETIFLESDPAEDPVSVFNEAWTFVDREYSFFNFKQIDWDQTYDNFRPQVSENMTEEELFAVLDDMLFILRDGHVNLRSPFNLSRNWEWYLNSPENFNEAVLERKYFEGEQTFVGPFITRDFGDVGYFRYESFSFTVEERDIDRITSMFQDKRGIIIDVRNNGGGSIGNALRIVRRFVDSERLLAIFRVKNGPGHEDFGELQGYTIEPEGTLFIKPVIILTNRRCYSATTFFSTMMSEIPNVTILGDTTGGGGGIPATTELANGWTLRVSSSQLATPDGFNVEDGLPPDIRVDITAQDEADSIDTILEAALEEIR